MTTGNGIYPPPPPPAVRAREKKNREILRPTGRMDNLENDPAIFNRYNLLPLPSSLPLSVSIENFRTLGEVREGSELGSVGMKRGGRSEPEHGEHRIGGR